MILAIAGTASAAITVSAGTHSIGGGAPGQTFEILISTDASTVIAGAVLKVQIGSTGTSCPDITNIDMVDDSSLIFLDAVDFTYTDYTTPGYPGLSRADVVSDGPSDDPIASGVLAIVTVDTTGYMTGTYAVTFMSTVAGDSNLIGESLGTVTFSAGSITVPEPATLALLGLGSLGVLIRRRRR